MLTKILAELAMALPEKLVVGMFHILKDWQVRACLRRAIRDITEDEITRAFIVKGESLEVAESYNRKNERRLRKEIRARLDVVLQSLTD